MTNKRNLWGVVFVALFVILPILAAPGVALAADEPGELCDLLSRFLTTAGMTAAVAFLISFVLEKIPGWHDRVPAELKQVIYAVLCFPIGFGVWFLAPKFGCPIPPLNDVILAVLLACWGFLSGSMFHLATKAGK